MELKFLNNNEQSDRQSKPMMDSQEQMLDFQQDNSYVNQNESRVHNRRVQSKHQLRRYQSSSVDENEFLDYIANPALRLQFDYTRQRQQTREINNIDQFKLISYGFDKSKAKHLLKSQALVIQQEQKKNENEDASEEVLPQYASVSLCCMSSSNPFRNKIIIFVTKNPYFDNFILIIIILNSLFLALDQEVDIVTSNSANIDLGFLIIYTCEMILKVIALGFIMQKNSYLRDPWNILDFIVVFFGWIANFVKSQGIQSVKILRILRPLKVIKKVPGMPKLVSTILDSLPVMVDVMLLFLFALVVFGTIATQTLGGDLKNSCVGKIDGKKVYLLGEKKERFLCLEQSQCDEITNSGKYEGGPFKCMHVGNPQMKQLSFDNILYAILNIFENISLVGWCDQMYWVRNSHGDNNMDFFFVAQVFIGNFVILVLLINVQAFFLDQAFGNEEKIEQEQKEKLKQKNITNKLFELQILEKIEENEKIGEMRKSQMRISQMNIKQENKNKLNINCRKLLPECLVRMSNSAEDMCNKNSYFKNSIILIIILNTICMASEYYDQPLWLTNLQQYANFVFTGFFSLEMFIKLFGYGVIKYFDDKFNCFDCFVVLMSFIDIGTSASGSDNSNLAIVKAFRLLRIFKLIKDWEKFKNIVFTLADSIKPIINLGILMILYLFISALLFKQLCKGNLLDDNGDPSRYGWNNTSQSLVTIFILLTGDLWTDIMHYTVSIENNIMLSVLIIFIFTLGHFMLLNLFLAVLLRAISKEDKQFEEEEQDEKEEEEELSELVELQRQIEKDLKNFQKDKQNQTPRTQKQNLKKKWADLQKLIQIQRKHKGKESQAIKDIEKKIMKEIKQEQVELVDLLQSDIDQEFEIMQNLVFDKCDEIAKGQGNDIQQKQQLSILFDIDQQNQEDQSNQIHLETRQDYSLFLFSPNNCIRVMATNIIQSHYFDNFINHIIALSCLLIALDQPDLPYQPGQEDAPYWPDQPDIQDVFQQETISLMINLTSFIFLAEFVLKIISKGFFFGENTYLKDYFNVLDFSIVIFSIITWILEATLGSKNSLTKGFRSLRALRPLRFVRSNESLKIVVNSIFKSLPELFSVTLIVLLFILVFGILGVQLFKGQLGSCSISDDSIQTKQDCLSYVLPSSNGSRILLEKTNISGSSQNLQSPSTTTESDTPTSESSDPQAPEWIVKSINYDNIFASMLTFFEITTFEGWSLMMFDATDTVGYDQVMVPKNKQWVQFIFIFYIFIMTFFVMNLFISVIVEKFKEEMKEFQGSKLLDREEFEWVKIQKLMVLANPKIVPAEPVNGFRRKCFNIVQSQAFEYMSVIAISFNSIFLCIYHDEQGSFYDRMQKISNYVLVGYFIFEIIIKIIAYGFKHFWSQVWNKFDAIIVGLSIIGFFEDQFKSVGLDITVLKIIRVTRLLRILKINRDLRKLLKTLLMSLRNILNVFILLILIWFVFSIIGMNIFSKLEFGEAYNPDGNFASFYIAFLLMIRCSTGGRWNDIMHEMYPDVGLISIFYWLLFVLICFFVLINVFIAVIGKSFTENQENTDINDILSIKKKDLKAFVDTWAKFNPGGEELMKTTRLPEFLKDLPTPLGYRGVNLQKQMVNKMIYCLNIIDRNGYVYYPEVMWSLFHALGGYNSENVLKCQEVEAILKEIKKKYKLLSQITQKLVLWNKQTQQKETVEIVEKIKVSMTTLCGNKYLMGQLSSFQYIQANKICMFYKAKLRMKKLKDMQQSQESQIAINS